MQRAGVYTRLGFTLVELLVATALGLLLAGVIIQVMALTAHTVEWTSSQVDVEGQARRALAQWDANLRDSWAVLTTYTLNRSPSTTFRTNVSGTRKTLVVALPAITPAGAPCAWNGIDVVFDCVVWDFVQQADQTWTLYRTTLTDAFQMPASYRTGYTVPTAFGRSNELTPVVLAKGIAAASFALALADDNGSTLAPIGAVTAPSQATVSSTLPLWTDSSGNLTTTTVSLTNVSQVYLSLCYQATASNLLSGKSTQSDQQIVNVRLRNKQAW